MPCSPVSPGALREIEGHFHALICERAASFGLDLTDVALPELTPLLTSFDQASTRRIWFAVPGMYGGFHYGLTVRGKRPMLLVDSWSRIVGGSGQRHEIGTDGARLVDSGFV